MTVKVSKFVINSNGNDIIDITEKVKSAVKKNNVQNALINVHSPFSSASVVVMEYTPELTVDFSYFTEKLIRNESAPYIKTAFIGNSATIPFVSGEFELDRFQRILLLDFDDKKRARSVIIQIIY